MDQQWGVLRVRPVDWWLYNEIEWEDGAQWHAVTVQERQ